ncbi:MAG: type II toxin-antitoxin system Phd/YefM family antitoxin [Raoultibacter sp.]
MHSAATALPIIRPISDLRTKLNDVEIEAKETGEPIIMTKNGVASLIVIDSAAYERRLQDDRVYLKLREAEIEAQYSSETYTLDQVKNRVDQILETARRIHADR